MISESAKKKIEDIKTGAIIVLLLILFLGTNKVDIDKVKESSYNRGYEAGIQATQSYWYDMGYLVGEDEGTSYGYDVGFENGYFEGYDDCLREHGLIVEQNTYIPQTKTG